MTLNSRRSFGRRADAQGELLKMKSALGDDAAYQYAALYAQWGDRAKALEWLDTAMRQRDGGLQELKTDPLMDPLRQEPRFQAIIGLFIAQDRRSYPPPLPAKRTRGSNARGV
jgi:hypothetical protein